LRTTQRVRVGEAEPSTRTPVPVTLVATRPSNVAAPVSSQNPRLDAASAVMFETVLPAPVVR